MVYGPIILSALFDVLFLVLGIVALALMGSVPTDRRKAVGTGGALLAIGSLAGLVLQAVGYYLQLANGLPPLVYGLVSLVPALVFLAGLFVLVTAATKRLTGRSSAPPPPPQPGRQPPHTR